MLRKDIEELMKSRKQKDICLIYNKEDKLGVYCFLQGGYLMDYSGHRVDRKKDIWGYIEWDNAGNGDRVDFANAERIPIMRGGKILCANS